MASPDSTGSTEPAPQPPADPAAQFANRRYVVLLILAALLGAPLAAGAFGFLEAVTHLQDLLFTDLPKDLGFHGVPLWWPLPLLAVAGVLVAAVVRFLPGTGGHEPADGLHVGGVAAPRELAGILAAALASLSLGVVLGPEAPLIALGGGGAAGRCPAARRGGPCGRARRRVRRFRGDQHSVRLAT